MADLFLSLTMVGETGPLPAPVPRGQVRTLRIAATDGPGGAAVAATGVAVEVRSPSGATVYSGGELTAAGTGLWTLPLALDARGAWVAQASATGPQEARSVDLPILVLGSAADAPVPAPLGPAVVDAEQSAAEAAQSAVDAATAAASALAAAPSLRHFASYTGLAAAAAAGTIPASVLRFTTGGRLAEGDGGAAVYIRRAALPAHAQYLLDTGPGGGYLVLEMGMTRPEVFGAVGVMRGDPASGSDAAIQAGIDYHEARGGGTMDFRTGLSYGLYSGGVTLKQNVAMIGPWPGGDRRPNANGAIDWTGATGPIFPCLVVDTVAVAFGITQLPNSYTHSLAGRRRGLTVSPRATGGTRAQIQQWEQDIVRGIAGTFIRIGSGGGALRGNDCFALNIFSLGFAVGVWGVNVPRTRIEHLTGDGNSLVRIDAAGDTVAVHVLKHFGFLTLNGGGVAVVRKAGSLSNNGGKVQLNLDVVHTTAITAWADNGGYARVDLGDEFQWHVEVGTVVTIAGLSGGASGLSGTTTIRSINNDSKTRVTLEMPWNAALTGQAGTFQTAAPDVSYLRPGDRIYLQNWAGVDPLAWAAHTATTTGGVGVLNSAARFVQSVDAPYQVTLTMDWDPALAGATCSLCISNGSRDGIAFNFAGADGVDATGLFSKGPVIGLYANAQNLQVTDYSFEPGAIGEGPVADAGTVGLWVGPDASRFRVKGGSLKSTGRTVVSERAGSEGVFIDQMQLSDGFVYTVDLRDGRLRLGNSVVYNGTPKFNFAGSVTPSNEGLFVVGGYVPPPILTVDTGSTVDPYRLYHAITDEDGGDFTWRGALRLKRRRANFGAGIDLWGTSEVRTYFVSLGEDDVEDGELATLRIGADQINNPNGNIILGSIINRTQPFDLTLDGSRASGVIAAGDEIVRLKANARNTSNQVRGFAQIAFDAKAVSPGSEAGRITLQTASGATLVDRLTISDESAVFHVPIVADGFPLVFSTTTTSDATPTVLTSDGAAASASNVGPLVANAGGDRARLVEIVVRAERTSAGSGGSAGDSAVWVLSNVLLSRALGVGSTQVDGGGPDLPPTRSRGGGSAWRVDVVANTTIGCLSIVAKGAGTTTIEWRTRMTWL